MMLEQFLGRHPDDVEVAAVPVPSPLLEDDVFVFVVPREGSALGPRAVEAFARETMPRHMVPLYVNVVGELPRTATNKIAKASLTERARAEIADGSVAPLR